VTALYLGLMSGTSADGIDAALVQFEPNLKVIASASLGYPASLRARILTLQQADARVSLDEFASLDVEIGEYFARVATQILSRDDVDEASVVGIGTHGQTLRHQPHGEFPFTLQVGDPNVIAERCRIPVVGDFRRRDVAAGGNGAPLVPAFHRGVFASADEQRAVLNLGGIANITLLPTSGAVRGFDNGPANCLMDAWAEKHFATPHDVGGAVAARGEVNEELLQRCLADPYFSELPPKSTGRDRFQLAWLDQHLSNLQIEPGDVMRTLLALTVDSVSADLIRYLPPIQRLLVCGGGVHNQFLMQQYVAKLPNVKVESTGAYGLDPDFVEAAAFAWLAWQTLAGRPGNLASVTGAQGERVLGAVFAR
jgi:anhydro-N-acetylmuramic acid kinase